MKVKLIYSKPQLEAAVRFIARNNENFKGQKDFIRSSILDHMREIATNPEQWSGGTMGYMLLGDRVDEGIDSDVNSITFDIWVDPAISSLWDGVEEIVEASEESVEVSEE